MRPCIMLESLVHNVMKLKITHRIWRNHPFSQRKKALKRAGESRKKIEKKREGQAIYGGLHKIGD